jgi:hypothetical protein
MRLHPWQKVERQESKNKVTTGDRIYFYKKFTLSYNKFSMGDIHYMGD